MKCPITYKESDYEYHPDGLKKINRGLKHLHNLPFTTEELRLEASMRTLKMSIQGVQPKLSAKLHVKQGKFEIADLGGQYIFKLPSLEYPEITENEDLTMRLATACGIEVPLHFLVWGKDKKLIYCIRRFDRIGRNKKVSVEDFSQLSGASRDTKYDSSMEKVAGVIDKYCTFPVVEKHKLLMRILFCFLTGNEDMHLKNFSVIHKNNHIRLSPAYDLLNTSIALSNPVEELALPLNSKKNKLSSKDFLEYYAKERLGLNDKTIFNVLRKLEQATHSWEIMIRNSFLSQNKQEEYLALLEERKHRLLKKS